MATNIAQRPAERPVTWTVFEWWQKHNMAAVLLTTLLIVIPLAIVGTVHILRQNSEIKYIKQSVNATANKVSSYDRRVASVEAGLQFLTPTVTPSPTPRFRTPTKTLPTLTPTPIR